MEQRKVLNLEEKVRLTAVVTMHKPPEKKRPDHLWEHFELGPTEIFKGKRYRYLISDNNLPLYPGELALMIGSEKISEYGLPFLHIDEVIGEKGFVVKEKEWVRVADASVCTKTENATYFNWITVNLNDWEVNVNVPTLAFGESLSAFGSAVVQITKIIRPYEHPERPGYLLYANFEDKG